MQYSFYILLLGEEMILNKNLFVELLLPRSITRKLDEEEMANYLEPFKEAGESRRPTLTWPREIPVLSDGLLLWN